jgi:hypothetical protein
MDYSLLMNLAVGGVAGGAISALYRWFTDRDLEAYKSELREAADKALAEHRSVIDERVQLALLTRKGAIEQETNSHLERLRADIGRDLRGHEARLRVAAELELRRYDKDLEFYLAARKAFVAANISFVECLGDQQGHAFEQRLAIARTKREFADEACALVPAPYRERVNANLDFIWRGIGELESALHSKPRLLVDEQVRYKAWEPVRKAAFNALDEFYSSIRELHATHIELLQPTGSTTAISETGPELRPEG